MKFLKPQKLKIILWIIAFMLLTLSAFIEKAINVNNDEVYIKIEERNFASKFFLEDSLRPLIKSFSSGVFIRGYPQIKLEKENLLVKLFAPDPIIFSDPIYTILILSIGLVFLVRLKKFNSDQPFSSKMIDGIKWAALLCLLFSGLNMLRYIFVNNKINSLTDNLYHLEKHTIF